MPPPARSAATAAAPALPFPAPNALAARLGGLATADLIAALAAAFRGRIALVSSFGADSAVLLHLVAEADPDMPVLFLDTGKLFTETLAYRDRLARRLGLRDLRVLRPDPAELAAADPLGRLWDADPDRLLRPAQNGAAGARLGGLRRLDQRPQAPPVRHPRRLAVVSKRRGRPVEGQPVGGVERGSAGRLSRGV